MTKLVEGCNYHTKWQSDKSMRFVLAKVVGEWSIVYTRKTRKLFWTKTDDLIFIKSDYNKQKAKDIAKIPHPEANGK